MSGISSLGVGSGLDLASLVDQLVAAERAPAQNRINLKQARAQTKLSAFGSLRSAISNLESSLEKLKSFEAGMKATSASPDAVSVTAGGAPVVGVYNVVVHELASAQSLASEAFDDIDAALGEGTLTLTVGDTVTEIELAEGANSLAAVRDAINESDAGVNAVIVRDGDAYRLLLTSAEPGAANVMTLTVDGSVDARLGSDQMTETAAARDAVFSVNGLELTASTNTLEDVIDGITLTLKHVGEDPVAITVEQDRESVRKALEDVVTKYNALVTQIRDLGRAGVEGAQSGPLVGDSTLRALESSLAGVFSAQHGEPGSGFERLLDLGFATDVQGKVSLDAAKLDEALATDSAGVEALVAAFAESVTGTLEAYTDDDGLLDARTDGLDAELKRLRNDRDALDRRMAQVEARLRAQFTALDSLLAQFQSTSNYLASQLGGLSNLML
ncbi:MAG TPA: flagellar filament capping protein FliD [Gammaproteobacteria bacterium]